MESLSNIAGNLSILSHNSNEIANNIVVRRGDGGLFNYTTLNGYRAVNTENNREYGVKGRYGYNSYTKGDIKPTNAKVYQDGKLVDPVLAPDNIGDGYRVPLRGEVIGSVRGFMTTDEFTKMGELLRERNLANNTEKNHTPYNVNSSYGVDFSQIGSETYSLDKNNWLPTDRNHKITDKFNGGSHSMTNPADNMPIPKTISYSYFQEEENGNVPSSLKKTSTSMNSVVALDDYSSASSLLKKTNELFKDGKIKSLINRFHTEKIYGDETTTAYDIKYGISRGRNLRKKKPGVGINDTGYSNPYCRVWTAHHQYSKLKDRIRPFYTDEGPLELSELHKKMGALRTANAAESLKNSVLKDDGFVRITPTHENGKDTEIKNYMFSIENLAWRDTIEHSGLYPSQIGESGGRIMWFPPYNLKFSENVSTQWNGHNFIGRGEQIYTYVNTERSGTLSFTLLIDHPSMINRWRGTSGTIGNDKSEAEQDLLRFFAGCGIDNLDTPLTGTDKKPADEKELEEEEENGKQPDNTTQAPITRSKKIAYVVFFPNDFSCRDYYTRKQMFAATKKISGYETSDAHIEWRERDHSYEKEILGVYNEVNVNSGEKLNNHPSAEIEQKIRSLLFNGDESIEIRYFMNSEDVDKSLVGTLNGNSYIGGLASKKGIGGMSLFEIGDGSDEETKYKGETKYKIDNILVKGFASSHGYELNNIELCKRRRAFIENLLKYKSPKIDDSQFIEEETDNEIKSGIIAIEKISEYDDVNLLTAKIARAAVAIFNITYKEDSRPVNTPSEDNVLTTNGYNLSGDAVKTENQSSPRESLTNTTIDTSQYTADAEYLYFTELSSDEMVYKNIVDKIRFFDPAFHSITPEGFNARLTFLHQCTRQGPTNAVSSGNINKNSTDYTKFAGNLSFGRAPYCILRIGDFYHTKICIDSLSIEYDNDGIQWDLNPEGAGVQPMFANVNINFKFIGGQDLEKPVERLQNAISANYYANASIYDKNAVQKIKKN